jgi:asparagine synthase (glutamine-hydrolysing)
MNASTTLAVADRPAAPGAPTGWVLALTFDERGRLTGSGAPLTARGPLRAFLDGFLYDRDELTARTGLDRGASDADLALALYEREGEDVLSQLRGSYALAILDEPRRRAVLSRDPLGFHPLYFAEAGGTAFFATSPLALVTQPGVSRALNRAALADHLCHRWPDKHETFFSSIRRVPPGWKATVGSGSVRVERYWHPAPEGQPIEFLTDVEVSHFDDVLDQAVDRCLATGPSGIFLSGGLDSISVAAVAADRARRRGAPIPWALSLAFPDPQCDERTTQTSAAGTLDLPLLLLGFDEAAGPGGLLAQAVALNAGSPAPVLNPWTPAYETLALGARDRGVETVLTGSGGDEWLGVSPFLAADLLRRGQLADLGNLAAAWHRSYLQSWPQVLRNTLWTFGLRPLAGLALDRAAPGVWRRSRTARLRRHDPAWVAPSADLRIEQQRRAEAALPPADPPGGFYARESRTCLDNTLVSWEREEQFQFGRRTGVRLLHPFWDADLLAHVYRLPPSFLNRGGRSKALVRDTLARRFPALGFERQRKVSAVTFFQSLLAGQLPALVDSMTDLSGLASSEVIDSTAAQAALRATVANPSRQTIRSLHKAWELVNLESWVRRNIS